MPIPWKRRRRGDRQKIVDVVVDVDLVDVIVDGDGDGDVAVIEGGTQDIADTFSDLQALTGVAS
jgi:hypothetical protein